jgi:hypothetical protein
MAGPPVYDSAHLTSLMAASVGAPRAQEIVGETLLQLGIAASGFDAETARLVLGRIGEQAGLVGITARVAMSRIELASRTSSSHPAQDKKKRPLSFVAGLISATVGEEKAEQIVETTAGSMGLKRNVDIDEALKLLESIARTSGVVGVAARFAKGRIHLTW